MSLKQALQKLETAVQEAVTNFFVLLGSGEAPEFWHENQDLKLIPIPSQPRRQPPRRDEYR